MTFTVTCVRCHQTVLTAIPMIGVPEATALRTHLHDQHGWPARPVAARADEAPGLEDLGILLQHFNVSRL